MSDLYIMLEEAYDAPNFAARVKILREIADRWKLPIAEVADYYSEFIDSDMFYAIKGI